jgi:23S rRNA (guanine745-N1)-methyltransferase
MGQTLRCGRGHSYDIAKEGYVNLLLANQKASAAPGDTKAMAISRRCFLEQGHYAPLSEAINLIVREQIARNETKAIRILDAGCGEGYYGDRLQKNLPPGTAAYGLDISKESIKLGASHYKQISFVVASLHQNLPFIEASFEVILNIFAPRHPAEFARVLRPDGRVLVVVPAEGHLAALHDALGLAQIDGDKERRTTADFVGALEVSRTETLRYKRVLPAEDVRHLIQMTPTFWQLSEAGRTSAKTLGSLEIEFAFTLLELMHTSEPTLEIK